MAAIDESLYESISPNYQAVGLPEKCRRRAEPREAGNFIILEMQQSSNYAPAMNSQAPGSVSQQFSSVFAAPVPFIIACAAVAAFIWFLANWAYGARIDRHKTTIEGLKEERDRLKARLDEKPSPSAPKTPEPISLAGQLIKTPKEQQLGSESLPSNSARTYADQLMAATVGLTTVKARDVIRNALGQPLTVSGDVIEVTDNMDKVTVSIAFDSEHRRSAWLSFDDDHDRIRRLNRGERITVTGIVKDISGDSIQMLNCSLA